MKITQKQLRRIIREEYRRIQSRRRLDEKYFLADSVDGSWTIRLDIKYDEASGDFTEEWSIEDANGNTVQEGEDAKKLFYLDDAIVAQLSGGNENLADELRGAISDVNTQVNSW